MSCRIGPAVPGEKAVLNTAAPPIEDKAAIDSSSPVSHESDAAISIASS